MELPSFDPVGSARTAVKSASRGTGYRAQVIAAADAEAKFSVYGHLLDVDLATPARVYVEASADYPATIRLAFEAAVTAFNDATEEPHSAAYDAARAVFEEAVTAIKHGQPLGHDLEAVLQSHLRDVSCRALQIRARVDEAV